MREINKTKYLAVFSIATLIFISGVITAQYINKIKLNEFVSAQTDLRNYILSLNLQTELAKKYECRVDTIRLTREKDKLGSQLDILENRLGKKDGDIKSLKEEYSLLSIRQWILFEEIREKCDKKIINIAFFYSNKNNETLCQSQGYVLDYLYKKYPNYVVIYALDYDIDDPALNTFKEIHNITQVPSIVILDKTYHGFQNKEKLEQIVTQEIKNIHIS